MITCAEAVRRMWEYIERELDPGDRERVDEHLDLCRRCCGELEFAKELSRFMAQEPDVDVPHTVTAKFEELLQDLDDKEATP